VESLKSHIPKIVIYNNNNSNNNYMKLYISHRKSL